MKYIDEWINESIKWLINKYDRRKRERKTGERNKISNKRKKRCKQ